MNKPSEQTWQSTHYLDRNNNLEKQIQIIFDCAADKMFVSQMVGIAPGILKIFPDDNKSCYLCSKFFSLYILIHEAHKLVLALVRQY